VSGSSAALVLERPETESETAAPLALVEPAPIRQAPRLLAGRRLPHPPGRRAHLWFAALVAGAVLAAVPSLVGGGPTEVTISASDYGLGSDSEVALTGGMDDAGARKGITNAEAQARLGELAASRAAREPKTVLPTQGVLTTCYCMRWGQMHWGIDLAAPLGTPIYAAVDGVVLRAGPATGFGNAIYIQDADGNVEIYGHMRYYSVQPGQIVHAGDQIAKVGNQGQSTGPHLHFELHRGGMEGRPFDPQPWLAARGVHV
jgi:murein DD-endopeptidase MepM/ murein hydrolase activator NlpD